MIRRLLFGSSLAGKTSLWTRGFSVANHPRYNWPSRIAEESKIPFSPSLSSRKATYHDNASWYWSNRAEIGEKYGLGNCVIVQDKLVAGCGSTFQDALLDAEARGVHILSDPFFTYVGMERYNEGAEVALKERPTDVLLVAQQIALPHPEEWAPKNRGEFEPVVFFTEYANCKRLFAVVPVQLSSAKPEFREKEFPVTFLVDSGAPRCSLATRYFRSSFQEDGLIGCICGERIGFVNPRSHGYYLPHENVNILSIDVMFGSEDIKRKIMETDIKDANNFRVTFTCDPEVFPDLLNPNERELFENSERRFREIFTD